MNNGVVDLIISAIEKHDTFAIAGHTNPDADAIGSCYAMAHILKAMGKKADVYVEEEIPKSLTFLPGKSIVYEEAKSYDVCLCIDCGDIRRVGVRSSLIDSAKVSINIDHHYANTNFANINLVVAQACSSGEICYDLIKQLGVDIDKDCAVCLYSAMSADTGGFKYSNTTPDSLRKAADLLEKKIDAAKINRLLFDTESIEQMRLKGEISNRVEIYCDGAVALSYLTKQMLEKYDLSDKEVDNICDIARRIEGVEVAISVKECASSIKISLRSNEYIDVSKIAEKFGGGGHVRASGLVLDCDFDTAKKKIVDEVIKTVKEYR